MRGPWPRIPRWAWLAAAVGLVGFVVVFRPWDAAPERVRAVVEGLREGPVYQEPGAPGVVNVRRAAEVIGDRAIVAAVLSTEPPPPSDHVNGPDYALCEEIAARVPTNLVVLFAVDEHGEYGSSYCTGPRFPAPASGKTGTDGFVLGLLTAAELSWKYRATDTNLTPELEEFVLTFDVEAGEHYAEIPRRGPLPDTLAAGQIATACAGMVLGTVALFLLLRGGALALRKQQRARRALARRRHAAEARLSRLADEIIHPAEPGTPGDADRARRYAHVLHLMRDAQAPHELAEVERELDELERVRTP